MEYKKEFDKYVDILVETYKKYHFETLDFREKNKVRHTMNKFENIVDNLVELCVINEGFSKLDLKLILENKINNS